MEVRQEYNSSWHMVQLEVSITGIPVHPVRVAVVPRKSVSELLKANMILLPSILILEFG